LNVILISLDTTRADRLGCYGYSLPTSPYLDAIAEAGVLFECAYASDIPTEVAHTSLFTGRVGLSTGVVAHGSDLSFLPKTEAWLPLLLRQTGFTTAAVDNLYQLKEWFARGYQYYLNTAGNRRWIDGRLVTDRAKAWLREHRGETFFLFLHYWDAHTPYLPPDGYVQKFYPAGRDPRDPARRGMDAAYNHKAYPFFKHHHYDLLGPVTDPEYVNALYDAELLYQDELLRELDACLAELGLVEDTLLILFGDHGESLTEHDIYWDHCGLYETTARVPVIMRWPGHIPAGRRVPGLVQQADLFPTILEAADVAVPQGRDGRSLWPAIAGEQEGTREMLFLSECAWQACRAVRTRRHKLIRTWDPGLFNRPEFELYDLETDPQESVDLAGTLPEIRTDLLQKMDEWIASTLRGRPDPMEVVLRERGLPFRRRIDAILAEVGWTWEAWSRNPDRRIYDGALAAAKKERRA
jgi:arylsulfatase